MRGGESRAACPELRVRCRAPVRRTRFVELLQFKAPGPPPARQRAKLRNPTNCRRVVDGTRRALSTGPPGPRDLGRSAGPSRPDAARAAEVFEAGDTVSHKTFGTGTVISVDGDMIEVQFEKSGKTKKLMKGFAPIVKL